MTFKLMPKRQALRGHSQGGFTLVELLVGAMIGLLSTIVIAAVVVAAENQKRTATTGSEAQVSGALGLYTLRRELEMAGYGIGIVPKAVACNLSAQYDGAAVAGFPAKLEPVVITQGANGAADTVRILASSKRHYAMPVRLVAAYDPADQGANGRAFKFEVVSNLGVDRNQRELMVAVRLQPDQACEVFAASGVSAAAQPTILRPDDNGWNANRFPVNGYGAGDALLNLGQFRDITFSINNGQLRQSEFDINTRNRRVSEVQSHVVNLQALYGKDSDGDGVVDRYDTTTPADNAAWMQVQTVMLALVTRSAHFEKDEVTTANPSWDVGTATTVDGAAECGDSKCLTLKVDGADDWKHYRYKVFSTVVPLRNMLWKQAS